MDDCTTRQEKGTFGYRAQTTGESSECDAENAQKAGNVRDQVVDLGRRTYQSVDESRHAAANALDSTASSLHSTGDRVSTAAHSAAQKLEATANYVRETDLRDMGNEVVRLVKRYPGRSLAIAAACGFLIARTLRRGD